MSQFQNNPYSTPAYGGDPFAASAAVEQRVAFIRMTYLHLAGAIGAFIMIELVLFNLFYPQVEQLCALLGRSRMGWLVVLGAFMLVSYIADNWARSSTSRSTQYLGLGTFVVAEAILFLPLLYVAGVVAPGAIQSAGIVTAIVFAGLTAIVMVSKADFSFLRYILPIGGLAAMAAIVAGIIMGFSLGIWFSGAMVALASGYILYSTSNIIHHYRTDQYVAAALSLFSSVALLFWYVLQIFMSRD